MSASKTRELPKSVYDSAVNRIVTNNPDNPFLKRVLRPGSESFVLQPNRPWRSISSDNPVWPWDYETVARVNSLNVDDVFRACQRDSEPNTSWFAWPTWLDKNARSMSVGDVVMVRYYDAWRVSGRGWTLVESNRPRRNVKKAY